MALKNWSGFTPAAVPAACGEFTVILDFQESFFPWLKQARRIL